MAEVLEAVAPRFLELLATGSYEPDPPETCLRVLHDDELWEHLQDMSLEERAAWMVCGEQSFMAALAELTCAAPAEVFLAMENDVVRVLWEDEEREGSSGMGSSSNGTGTVNGNGNGSRPNSFNAKRSGLDKREMPFRRTRHDAASKEADWLLDGFLLGEGQACACSLLVGDLERLRVCLKAVICCQIWRLPLQQAADSVIQRVEQGATAVCRSPSSISNPSVMVSGVEVAASCHSTVLTVCGMTPAAFVSRKLLAGLGKAKCRPGSVHRLLSATAGAKTPSNTEGGGEVRLGSREMRDMWGAMTDSERLNLLRELGDVADSLGQAGRNSYQEGIVALVQRVHPSASMHRDKVVDRQLLALECSTGDSVLEVFGLCSIKACTETSGVAAKLR
ncbi:unnamed protein product, partial [Chrysoparadoxa australica]